MIMLKYTIKREDRRKHTPWPGGKKQSRCTIKVRSTRLILTIAKIAHMHLGMNKVVVKSSRKVNHSVSHLKGCCSIMLGKYAEGI